MSAYATQRVLHWLLAGGLECEHTYYVYSPLTNIVERVGTQGAAFGSTNALRTVTAFYPVTVASGSVGAADPAARSGFVASIRHEDGRLDIYDYSLVSNLWARTVTHLHEQSPSPVSGKTTRDITVTNVRGEEIEACTEAYIDGIWYTIARNRMTYNSEGKRKTLENLAGQIMTTAWDCCHKVSEVQPDGSTTTWDYDDEGRVIASSRLIPLDMTNVTWLTTCYEYDDLGRQTATWQTNLAAQVGLPATRTRYDALGRVIASVDRPGNTTTTTYSPDGRTVSVHNPNTSTRITTRSASGDTLSITGTAVTPEFHTYGVTNLDVAATPSSSQTFQPQFDDDGNQTLVKTATGIWSVTYNGENRPIFWSNGSKNIVMSFDRMGRRVIKNDQRFVYDRYLCIKKIEDSTAIHYSLSPIHYFVWDPTEKIATRPLVWNFSTLQPFDFSTSYYTHDGNKNVSEVVVENGEIVAHYEYAPFGAVINQREMPAMANPWRFSGEYADDVTATVYYNYRHYEPMDGRWTSRDLEEENFSNMLYSFCENDASRIDGLGLKIVWLWNGFVETNDFTLAEAGRLSRLREELGLPPGLPLAWSETSAKVSVECECRHGENGWFYKKAYVEVMEKVHYYEKRLYGIRKGRPPFKFVQKKEMDHVNDARDFTFEQQKDKDFKWYHIELNLFLVRYGDEESCKKGNLIKITPLVNESVMNSDKESHMRWDASGKHTWHGN